MALLFPAHVCPRAHLYYNLGKWAKWASIITAHGAHIFDSVSRMSKGLVQSVHLVQHVRVLERIEQTEHAIFIHAHSWYSRFKIVNGVNVFTLVHVFIFL